MSDAAATLPADMLALTNALMKDMETAKAGMTDAEKLAEKGVAEENKALSAKSDLIGKQRQETKDFDATHPFPKPDIKPWEAKPPENDPMKAFGSWASAFGILAGAITHTGLASSLNASAAAINAFRKNDMDAYNEAKSAWQENTKIALEQAEWESKAYEHGWKLMETDQAAGLSQLEIAASQAKNTQLLAQLRAGNYKEAFDMTKGIADFVAAGPARMAAMEDHATKMEDTQARAKILAEWTAKNPNATPEEKAQKRTEILNPQYTINQAKTIAEGAGGAGGMANDPVTINYWAKRVRAGEAMPSLGIGKDAAISRRLIAQKAAHDAYENGGSAEGDIVKRAVLNSEKSSLKDQIAQKHAISQFENTAVKNADVAIDLVNKVDTTGIPVAERWLRAGMKAVAGDTDVTNFDFQIGVLVPEIAKIITNPTLRGILSDSARQEAQALIDHNITANQLKELIPLMKNDFKRRSQAIDEEILTTEKSIGDLGSMNAGNYGNSSTTSAKKSFKDEAAATKAFENKDIQVGDTVMIDGVEHTVGQ